MRVFFEAGSNVVFCSRGLEEGEALAAELNAHSSQGQRAVMVKADVSKVGLALQSGCNQPLHLLARSRVIFALMSGA